MYNLRRFDFTQTFTPLYYQGLRCLATANADLFVATTVLSDLAFDTLSFKMKWQRNVLGGKKES